MAEAINRETLCNLILGADSLAELEYLRARYEPSWIAAHTYLAERRAKVLETQLDLKWSGT